MTDKQHEAPRAPNPFGAMTVRPRNAADLYDATESAELRALAAEAGISIPVAFTVAAFNLAVWPMDVLDAKIEQNYLEQRGEDVKSRLWEVYMAFRAEQQHQGERTRFEFGVTAVVWPHGRRRVIMAAAIGETLVFSLASEV